MLILSQHYLPRCNDDDDDVMVICVQLLVGSPGTGSAAAAADLQPNSHSEMDQQYQTSLGRNISK